MESVYGDRNHQSRTERKEILERIIKDNIARKGTLVIPTFSLERSQELLFEINDLAERGRIPLVPFFFDSPLAILLTDVYEKHQELFNKEAKEKIARGDHIFLFPGLKRTPQTEQSKMILSVPNPKIVIAGSGMSNGGRILHHEKNYLPDSNNTLLLTGYQSVGTLGRLIEDGAKTIKIMGEEIPVHARVEKITGYSGHKDSDNLVEFVSHTSKTVKKIFTVMGEPRSAMFLAQKLHAELGIEAIAPSFGDEVELEF